MRDAGKEAEEVMADLTKAALRLEGRALRERRVSFPGGLGPPRITATINTVAYGGQIDAESLGELIYYIADILEGADNWK